jgi:hypothetical protein
LVPHIEADPGRLPYRHPEELAIRDLATALNARSLRERLRQADAVPSDRPAEVHDFAGLAKEDEGDHFNERQQQELRDECDEPNPRRVLGHRPKAVSPDVVARRFERRGPHPPGESDRVAGFSSRLDPNVVTGETGAPADVQILGERSHSRIPSMEGAEHLVPHQHARRGDVEDLRSGVVLPEIDLALFEALVGISETVRRHPDLL